MLPPLFCLGPKRPTQALTFCLHGCQYSHWMTPDGYMPASQPTTARPMRAAIWAAPAPASTEATTPPSQPSPTQAGTLTGHVAPPFLSRGRRGALS